MKLASFSGKAELKFSHAYISLSEKLSAKNPMTDLEFTELCIDICRCLGCDDIYQLAESGEIILDDVRLGLYYSAEAGGVISCFVDVGLVEDTLRSVVFENILVLNLEINGVNGESLGFERNSGHLVLRASILPGSGFGAAQLAECLRDYSLFVQKVRSEVLSNKDVQSDEFLSALV